MDTRSCKYLEQATPMARLAYFMAGNLQISSYAKKPSREKHLICVRYIFSTLAYHSAIEDVDVVNLQPVVKVFSQWLMLPDVVIFLDVTREVQLSRMKERADDKLQTGLANSTEFQYRLRKAYTDVKSMFNVPWVEIDTSYIDPQEVAKRIKMTIQLLTKQ